MKKDITLLPLVLLPDNHTYAELTEDIAPALRDFIKRTFKDPEKAVITIGMLDEAEANSVGVQFQDGEFTEMLNDGDWDNGVDIPDTDRKIAPKKVRKKFSPTASPDEIELMAKNYYTGGAGHRVPLWHSGIVVTIGPFSSNDIITMQTRMESLQVELGKATNGAIFSGDDCHLVNVIVDHILDHLTDCNVEGYHRNYRKLKDLILVADLPYLMAGALATINPGGYPLTYNCISRLYPIKEDENTAPCDFVISPEIGEDGIPKPNMMLNFLECMVEDKTRITDKMVQFMAKGATKYKKADILNYQRDFVPEIQNCSEPKVLIDDDDGHTSIQFRIPTVTEYLDAGALWCQAITNRINRVLGTAVIDVDDKEAIRKREDTFVTYTAVAQITNHMPWIKSLTFRDFDDETGDIVNKEISDQAQIKAWLGMMTDISGASTKLESLVQEYKEEAFYTFTAMPNYDCPKCGTSQAPESSTYPTKIPMNMVAYFFTLTGYRVTTMLRNL